MRILYTSDIHANASFLDQLMDRAAQSDVDVLIIGGDIVPHYLPHISAPSPLDAQARYVRHTLLPALRTLKATHQVIIYLDLGNDDFMGNRRLLADCEPELLHLLHMSRHPLTDNVDVMGYMMVPPTPFGRKDWEKPDCPGWPHAPDAHVILDGCQSADGRLTPIRLDLGSTDTIARDLARLEQTIDRPFIFVSHSPPYDTPLDVIHSGHHVGSISVRRFIQRWADKGLLIGALHGHIHESFQRSGTIHTHIGSALCINPGQNSGPGATLRYLMLELEADVPKPSLTPLHPSFLDPQH